MYDKKFSSVRRAYGSYGHVNVSMTRQTLATLGLHCPSTPSLPQSSQPHFFKVLTASTDLLLTLVSRSKLIFASYWQRDNLTFNRRCWPKAIIRNA